MMTKTTSTDVSKPSASKLNAIRSVALRIFVNEGYHAVSMRQLAMQAGVQAGSLYHYFESKGCLLFELIEEHEYYLLHSISKTPFARVDPRSALGHYLGAYLQFALSRRQWHILSTRESYCLETVQRAKIEKLRAKQEQILKDIIALGIAGKRFKVNDLKIAAVVVRAMLDGAVLGPTNDDFRTEVLIKDVQQMVLRSLFVDRE
jgi:AcrR family transcriptional regulator